MEMSKHRSHTYSTWHLLKAGQEVVKTATPPQQACVELSRATGQIFIAQDLNNLFVYLKHGCSSQIVKLGKRESQTFCIELA